MLNDLYRRYGNLYRKGENTLDFGYVMVQGRHVIIMHVHVQCMYIQIKSCYSSLSTIPSKSIVSILAQMCEADWTERLAIHVHVKLMSLIAHYLFVHPHILLHSKWLPPAIIILLLYMYMYAHVQCHKCTCTCILCHLPGSF